MRKYLIKISVFILLFALSNFVYLKLVQRYDWNFAKVIKINAFENQDYEYLIIGNSLALDGFDMEYFNEQGMHAYNTAIAGASLKTNIIQLENYLAKNKAPKMIIQGLSSYRNTDFNSDKIHPAVDYLYPIERMDYKDIPMIKFKWMADELLKKIVSKNHRQAEILDGQLRTKKTVPDISSYPIPMDKEINLSRYEDAKYLTSIDSICREHNIRLISIEMPAYKKFQNNAALGPIEYQNTKDIKNSFYNCNNKEFCLLFDPKKDWLGDSHLNLYGSQKFTRKLFELGIISR